jgi:hypothetical protein
MQRPAGCSTTRYDRPLTWQFPPIEPIDATIEVGISEQPSWKSNA